MLHITWKILRIGLVLLVLLSSGCVTNALWESARVTERPLKVKFVKFLPNGDVEIIYPVSLRKSQFRLMSMFGNVVTRPYDPPRVVYRKIVLCQDHMRKWDVSHGDGQSLRDYIDGYQFNDIYRRNQFPKGENLWCCESVMPDRVSLGEYTLDEAMANSSPAGMPVVEREITRMMADYAKLNAEKKDTGEEHLRLKTSFETELAKAMASSDFILRKNMRHERPPNVDPLTVESKHIEYYVNDYLVKLEDGTWARFSLPERKGIPKDHLSSTLALTPLTVVADVVLLPVEIVVGVLGAVATGSAIPH